LHYQWKKGVTAVGTDSASFAIASAAVGDAGSYTVTVSNAADSVTSAAAVLTVTTGPTAPSITTQPASQAVSAGASATFTVVATGTAPLHYQWKKGTTALGTDSATFTITSAKDTDAGSYTVTVSNDVSSVVSNAAVLTVNAPSLNLALHKNATASTSENATLDASKAVDGDTATRWASSFVDPSWIAVDLGSSLTFNHVVLRWEPAYAKKYVIQTSTDNSVWTTVYTQDNGAGGVEDFTFTSATARYIRMNGTVRATAYGYSLWEFEVYNTPQYAITASAGAHGSISPAGSVTVNQGLSQAYVIAPDAGYMVKDVLVDGVSVGAVTSYAFSNVQSAHTISASFDVLPSYAITVTAGAHGSVTPGTLSVLHGSNQTFSIAAATGYTVDTVTVDGVSQGPITTYTFSNVKAAHTIAATFKVPANFTITATADLNGSISPSGAVSVTQGTDKTFTITPDQGHSIKVLTVDGQPVTAANTYTFKNVQAAHTISVTFQVGSAYAWNDEFEGPTLDTSKWTFDIGNGSGGWGNGEKEYYSSSKDNVAIENGSLVITAKKENFGGQPFTSARLLTRGKFNFQYGHIEARIKFPVGGQMIWPCFWMLGDTSTGWPKTNEIDIAEMFGGSYSNPTATYGDDVVSAHAFWWSENVVGGVDKGGNADTGKIKKLSSNLSSAYRTYALEWTPNYLKAYVWEDGQTIDRANPYWEIALVNKNGIPTATMSELLGPDYLLLNFAIGQPQWGMTDPNQAAALPQKMYIDYIRVTDVPASTFDVYEEQPAGSGTWVKAATLDDPGIAAVVKDKAATQIHGSLGVMAHEDACPTNLVFGSDANLFVWQDTMTQATCDRATGFALQEVPAKGWFGAGIATTNRYNMLNFAAGALHVSVKTASTDPFLIGISGGNDGNSWVTLTSGGSKSYDFPRDNQWHDITIPMTNFISSDFTDISQFFMFMSGATVTSGQIYQFDNIYWTENEAARTVTPVGTKFGVLTAGACDAGKYDRNADGAVNNWNTANGSIAAGSLGEGSSFSFSAPAGDWYGMGLAANKLYNLSAFANGHLHFSMKVASGGVLPFKIGIKSPGGTAVRESWIKMGLTEYPVTADGAFHDYSIPATEFLNSDFSAISQHFMISGVGGPMTMEIANIYWTND